MHNFGETMGALPKTAPAARPSRGFCGGRSQPWLRNTHRVRRQSGNCGSGERRKRRGEGREGEKEEKGRRKRRGEGREGEKEEKGRRKRRGEGREGEKGRRKRRGEGREGEKEEKGRAKAEELGAGGEEQPLFLPSPSFVASAEGEEGFGAPLALSLSPLCNWCTSTFLGQAWAEATGGLRRAARRLMEVGADCPREPGSVYDIYCRPHTTDDEIERLFNTISIPLFLRDFNPTPHFRRRIFHDPPESGTHATANHNLAHYWRQPGGGVVLAERWLGRECGVRNARDSGGA